VAAGALGQYIRYNDAFLRAAHVPRGEIALLTSKANAIFLRGVDDEERLFAAQRGAYSALWELDYRVDFITPAQVIDGTVAAYRVVVLPLMALLDEETAVALQEFVANGGLLVGFARCGTLNKKGWYHRHLPIPGLQEAFGLAHIEADAPPVPTVQFGGQTYDGFLNRDTLQPKANTQIVAQFADGLPAITLAQHQEGHGLYIATQADSAHVQTKNPLLKDVMANVLAQLNILPAVQLFYEGRQMRELDAHLLETKERTTILIANYFKQDAEVKVVVAGNGRTPTTIETGLGEKKSSVSWVEEDGRIIIQQPIPKETPAAIDIHWQK
jgi:beta-galactosidase GanA